MSSDRTHAAFTGPMETHSFAGILLDLDGTIVDSTDAIVKHWHESVSSVALQICCHQPGFIAHVS